MSHSLLSNLSITRKLSALVVVSCLLVSLVTSALFVGLDIVSLRRSMVEELSGLAKVIGINCKAPLEFMDTETAHEVLSSLNVRPHILQAILYSQDGKIFAQYQLDSVTENDRKGLRDHLKHNYSLFEEESYNFRKASIDLSVPIGEPGEVIGAIVLQANQDEFQMILLRLLYAVIGMFTASLLLAFFFSSVLNKIVSRPILALADTMDRVHQEKNYSIRAKKTSRDEIGVLVEGVNSMLEGIEQRDEQLLVAKEIAENANLAKSQFLAQMSHEIRTPMNGVLGIASLLLHTSLNEKQTNFVHTIRTSGESLLGLINDILDSSKIEAGKLELELISFNIRHMAEETVDLLSKHASEKNVNLACVVSTDVPAYVEGDPGRLRQIFMNLLGNALKFTSYGEVILYISEEKRDNDDVYLRFEIKDSGIGVNKNKQKEIFVAFSQVDESTTRKFGGTGLGLAICRSLVHLMGGTIGIESEEGKGSVFWFTVMLGMGSTSDVIVGLLPEKTFFQKFDAFVLVVEDNITNQIVAQGTLEKMGCKVELAGNGLEAVSAVEKKQYDLIFMDCQMPVMDGYEATVKIRKKSSGQEMEYVPIVALTAHAMKGDRERCLAVGMDDYIAKPFDEQQLERVLLKWVPHEN